LKPSIPVAAGLAQLTALEMHFRKDRATPQLQAFIANAGFRLALEPLLTEGVGAEKNSLWLLQGGAILVLLIGCVNVVNLFLARMNSKRTELAIRAALGAGRAAPVRQVLAESLLQTGAASATGIGLATMALRVFNQYLAIMAPAAPPVTFDAAVTRVIVAAACGIALLVGFLPMQLLWRTGLRPGSLRTTSASGGARAVSSALVTSQVAIAGLLLLGASLLIHSFANVTAINPGFDAAHVVQGRIALPSRYKNAAANVGV
jgi:putative ABC transport system permease protein